MAKEVRIPEVGESISQVMLVRWLKDDGALVERDEPVCLLETDKASIDLPAPAMGILRQIEPANTELAVGAIVARIEEDGAAGGAGVETARTAGTHRDTEPPLGETVKPGALSPAVRRLVRKHGLDAAALQGTGRGGRLTRKDVLDYLAAPAAPTAVPVDEPAPVEKTAPEPGAPTAVLPPVESDVERRPMSQIRRRIGQHLVAAQRETAMLTTFNEVDMAAVVETRKRYKNRFAEVHGVGLGLMSFFSRAAVLALGEFPVLNARIDGSDIVYHRHVHMSIAVSTERGLMVPVLKHAENMSLARIEAEIKRLAGAARDNRLGLDELSDGTFTITNGGVFGSMLSTPILNAPQSGILGLHAIEERPVAIGGEVVIHPMMYVALSYDHRLVDGQQSVSFLVRVKEMLEDPVLLLLEL